MTANTASEPDTNKCPFCGTSNAADSLFCSECGTHLRDNVENQGRGTVRDNKATRILEDNYTNTSYGRTLDIASLPDELLYTQYLAKEFLAHMKRSKKPPELEDTSKKLSVFANLHLYLFTMEQAVRERNLTRATELTEYLTNELQHILETHVKQKAAEIQDRLDLIEENFPPETVKHFRATLEAIASGPQDLAHSIEILADISNQIHQPSAPARLIVCKVNVFPHGHRDLFEISSDETLEHLAEKIKTKYAKEIEAYLYKIHKGRVPRSEVELIFVNDVVDITDPASLLDKDTVLLDIPQRDTEGVTWYPQWIRSDDDIYTQPLTELDILQPPEWLRALPTGDEPPTARDKVLPKGTILQNRYEVRRVVGVGGVGAVYLTQDLRFTGVKRFCVLREMISTASDPQVRRLAVEAFKREANLLVQVRHSGIPQIYDFFTDNVRSYLAMEYVAGEDLENVLQNTEGMLKEEMVVAWATQLCDILFYLHNELNPPVIHRDVKPSHIILGSDNRISLIGFGLAHRQPRERLDMIGTEGYSPPEQYKGITDQRSDIYSLAATLHHLLTKRDPRLEPPFTFHETPVYSRNPEVSQKTNDAIMRALEYNPGDRYQSVEEMKMALLP